MADENVRRHGRNFLSNAGKSEQSVDKFSAAWSPTPKLRSVATILIPNSLDGREEAGRHLIRVAMQFRGLAKILTVLSFRALCQCVKIKGTNALLNLVWNQPCLLRRHLSIHETGKKKCMREALQVIDQQVCLSILHEVDQVLPLVKKFLAGVNKENFCRIVHVFAASLIDRRKGTRDLTHFHSRARCCQRLPLVPTNLRCQRETLSKDCPSCVRHHGLRLVASLRLYC